MSYVPIDGLRDKTNSTYKLVILAARRAIELSEGAAKLVETKPDEKPGNIALMEVIEGKIGYKVKE